jgi:hypothetical protein
MGRPLIYGLNVSAGRPALGIWAGKIARTLHSQIGIEIGYPCI